MTDVNHVNDVGSLVRAHAVSEEAAPMELGPGAGEAGQPVRPTGLDRHPQTPQQLGRPGRLSPTS